MTEIAQRVQGRRSLAEPVLRMAGEIAAQFAHRPPQEAAAAVAGHIRSFWDPRMRHALRAARDQDMVTDLVVSMAVELLAQRAVPDLVSGT